MNEDVNHFSSLLINNIYVLHFLILIHIWLLCLLFVALQFTFVTILTLWFFVLVIGESKWSIATQKNKK
jgi:hypothetical protein